MSCSFDPYNGLRFVLFYKLVFRELAHFGYIELLFLIVVNLCEKMY